MATYPRARTAAQPGARKKVFVPGYKGCIQHMREQMFGTYGDTAQAAYHVSRVGTRPTKDKPSYLTADAFYPRNPDARYKTNKGNMSHVVLGDDRDWNLTSISEEKFKGLRCPIQRGELVEGFSGMDPVARAQVYEIALRRVGPSAIALLERLVRDKVMQRTGGILEIRKGFKFLDRSGEGVLTPEEFQAALDGYGLQFEDDQLVALFSQHDKEAIGLLDYYQFMKALLSDQFNWQDPESNAEPENRPCVLAVPESPSTSMQFGQSRRAPLQRVREMFDRFDIAKTGQLDARNLRILLDQLGMGTYTDKLRAAMDALDPDGIGLVRWDAFAQWWTDICMLRGENSPQRGQSLTPTAQFRRWVPNTHMQSVLWEQGDSTALGFRLPDPAVRRQLRAPVPKVAQSRAQIDRTLVASRQRARECSQAYGPRGAVTAMAPRIILKHLNPGQSGVAGVSTAFKTTVGGPVYAHQQMVQGPVHG